jgi:hypothetical protein
VCCCAESLRLYFDICCDVADVIDLVSVVVSGYILIFCCLIRLLAVVTLKRYSKALEYEYRVKTAALGTLK